MLEQQVVVLADGAVDDVLDRNDSGRGAARGDRLEDLAEAAEWSPRDVTERGEDGVLGEGAGLAGVDDRRPGLGGSWPSCQVLVWSRASARGLICSVTRVGGIGVGLVLQFAFRAADDRRDDRLELVADGCLSRDGVVVDRIQVRCCAAALSQDLGRA